MSSLSSISPVIPDLATWSSLRERIALQLLTMPIDERALCIVVAAYARATSASGISTGQLIRSIGQLVGVPSPVPLSRRERLMQLIAVACIEARFEPRGPRAPRHRPVHAE